MKPLDKPRTSLGKKDNPWVVWGIANMFYLYEVILRVSPSVMTDDLMLHYNITSGMLGVMISCFYYSYTLLQIPCGLVLDKLGPRNLVGSSVVLSITGLILFSITHNVYWAQFGRCIVGAGAACAFISCLQIASMVFPVNHFALFAGITNMMGTIGALCGGFPIAKSVNHLGWQATIFIQSAIGVIIAVLAFAYIPRKIKFPEHGNKSRSFGTIFGKVVRNKQIILIGLMGGFMYLPVSVFSELWAVPFFISKYGITNEIAALASSVLFIGFALGSIPVAMIAHRVNGYMQTIRFGIGGIALIFIPLIYVQNLWMSFLLVFLLGMLTATEVLIFTCAKNNESARNSGTAISLANGLVMLAGAVFQPALGILLDVFWTGLTTDNGLRIYDISSYQQAILTLPACLLVAYVLSWFVEETIQKE
ncbi:MAG: MFS transporter [Holosporaceae bacterium]|jgi:MFS family permease|nr:MFS transporter [Holosporaceae bacterium]